MNLGEGSRFVVSSAISRWRLYRPSQLSFHGDAKCCVIARKWFVAMDRSFRVSENILSGPRWIRQRWRWGPCRWPLYWCALGNVDTLDCGALAALAGEAFRGRGLVTFPAQLIQQFSPQDARHWRRSWERAALPADWLLDGLAYHEACAVLVGERRIRVWDPVDCTWIHPSEVQGYGVTVAIRIDAMESQLSEALFWETFEIQLGEWRILVEGVSA